MTNESDSLPFEEITELLSKLTDAMAHADLLTMQERSLIDELIPEDIKAKIADIMVEFFGQRETVAAQIEALKERITRQVLQEGTSSSGGSIQAVYQPG